VRKRGNRAAQARGEGMGLLPALTFTASPGCRTQDEPAFCGLASLAMVLNALSIGEAPAAPAAWCPVPIVSGPVHWLSTARGQRFGLHLPIRGADAADPAAGLWLHSLNRASSVPGPGAEEAEISLPSPEPRADPRRAWKGPWRWFHEALLDCCAPLQRVAQDGVTLTQVGDAASPGFSNFVISWQHVSASARRQCSGAANSSGDGVFLSWGLAWC
jgi:Phytochelatin synthase